MKPVKEKIYIVRSRMGIPLGVDDTDHIVFNCPECNSPLEVTKVTTIKVGISMDCKEEDKCTWIRLACLKCKIIGQRKFYWTSEDGRFCRHTTNNKEPNFWRNSK